MYRIFGMQLRLTPNRILHLNQEFVRSSRSTKKVDTSCVQSTQNFLNQEEKDAIDALVRLHEIRSLKPLRSRVARKDK